MSGRNWTRRSIEELVEAYLRGKVKGGGKLYPAFVENLKPLILGTTDPDSFGTIPVGYLSNSAEGGMGAFDWYYPKSTASQAYANYVVPYFWYGGGSSRYVNISGTFGRDAGPSISGSIMKLGPKDTEGFPTRVRFQVLIVPKDCIFSYIKKIVVTDAESFVNGCWCLVTCDPTNEHLHSNEDILLKRTMFIPRRNDKVPDISTLPLPVTLINDSYPNNMLKTTGTTGSPILSVNATYLSDAYGDTNLYPNYYVESFPGYKSIVSAASLSGTSGARTTSFINTVQSDYDGEFEYEDATRPTNYLALIRIDTASGDSNQLDVEKNFYMISRMILDGYSYYQGIKWNVLGMTALPQYYNEVPVFDTPIKKFWVGHPGSLIIPNTMVQYKKEYVTIT